MKKRFIIALSTVLVFALAVVAFAYTRTNNTTQTSASCPMHEKKDAVVSAEKEKHSCGMVDCCKDGQCKMGGSCCKDKDSCPMKNKENQTAGVDYSKITFTDGNGASCCKPGASCCNGGSCCKGKLS